MIKLYHKPTYQNVSASGRLLPPLTDGFAQVPWETLLIQFTGSLWFLLHYDRISVHSTAPVANKHTGLCRYMYVYRGQQTTPIF